jgi:steroid 5-alpha reductase family enzyme
MATDSELQQLSELADARLGVAEDFSWPIAALSFLVVFFRWDNWLLGVLAGVAGLALSIFWYRREANRAEDAYFRQAKIGKYYEAPKAPDA